VATSTADPPPNPVESPPLAPSQVHSKVGAGAFAGALTVLAVWGIDSAGIDIPAEAAVALSVVFSFIAGYIAKS